LFAKSAGAKLGYMQPAIQLSADEWDALQRGEPLHLRDKNAHELVLVLAEQYERLKKLVDIADADPKAYYPLIASVLPDDWEEPSAYPRAEKL
jgi:hypothetical protein